MNPCRPALPLALALLGLLAAARPAPATTYHWVGGGDDSWSTAAHWNPARTTPQTTDVLVFDRGDSMAVNGVPTQTIAQLWVTAGSTVLLQAAAPATLTLGGPSASPLEIDALCRVYLSGANAITLSLPAGTSGAVAGDVILRDGAHRLTATEVDGLGFYNASSLQTRGTFSGNAFGTTNLNSVRFHPGSLYVSGAGANPFGAAQPGSVVRFDHGSRFRLDAGTPAASGRTYGDFEVNLAGATSMGGTSTVTIDSLIITRGTLSVATSSARINGAIRVPTGSFLQFNPASAATYTLGGTSPQWVRSPATNFTLASTVTLAIDNPAGVYADSIFFRMPATLQFVHGNLVLPSPGPDSAGFAMIDPPGTITGADSTTGWIVGGLRIVVPGSSSAVLPIGAADRYLPMIVSLDGGAAEPFTAWSFGHEDPTIAGAQLKLDQLVHRTWCLNYPTESYNQVGVQVFCRRADLDPGVHQDSLRIRYRSNTHGWKRQDGLTITGDLSYAALFSPGLSQTSFRWAVGEDARVYLDGGRVVQPEAVSPLVLPVTLSQASLDTVRVHYGVLDSTALASDNDYVTNTGTLVFAPGETARSIPVTVIDDAVPEPDESFLLLMNQAQNAYVRYRGEGVILDDDDVQPPTVQLLSPNGGEHAVIGTVVPVGWSATDDVGVTSVDLLLSRDGGATEELVASGLPNTGSFHWTVTGPVTSAARIKAIAHDAAGHQAGDASDATFFIDDVAGVPPPALPTAFALAPVAPNPARDEARFAIALPRRAQVRLSVVDVRGRAVATLVERELEAGVHPVAWDGRIGGRRAPAGIYFVRCEAGSFAARSRFVLLR